MRLHQDTVRGADRPFRHLYGDVCKHGGEELKVSKPDLLYKDVVTKLDNERNLALAWSHHVLVAGSGQDGAC